jgi:hypothetical protein
MNQPTRLLVSGQSVTVLPYTEKRREALAKVHRKIEAYTVANEDMVFDAMPTDVKAGFWKAKADVLWNHDFEATFFESDDFEVELLADTEASFHEQANESLELAEEYFGTARNFQGTGLASGMGKKMIWTNQMGSYRYKAFILAGFDPSRADTIFDMRADEIAAAYVSKMCYEYTEPKNKPTR